MELKVLSLLVSLIVTTSYVDAEDKALKNNINTIEDSLELSAVNHQFDTELRSRRSAQATTKKPSKVERVVKKIKEKAPGLIQKAREKGYDKKAGKVLAKGLSKAAKKLGTGALVGIVFGVLGVLGLAGAAYFLYNRSRDSSDPEENVEM